TVLTGASLRCRLPAGVTLGAISDGGAPDATGDVVWPIGAIALSADIRRTISVTVDGSVAAGAILAARAELRYDGGNAVDNVSEYAVPVIGAPQAITVVVSPAPSSATPGAQLSYITTVTNISAIGVNGVVVLWRIPTGLQLNAANAQPGLVGGGCAASAVSSSALCAANQEAYWTFGTLAAGASEIITVTAAVAATLPQGSLIASSYAVAATGLAAPVVVESVVPTHM
ncbi:MAG: hypothetical protein ACREOE_20420, partial [Gemmatimonadales bacterium]